MARPKGSDDEPSPQPNFDQKAVVVNSRFARICRPYIEGPELLHLSEFAHSYRRATIGSTRAARRAGM